MYAVIRVRGQVSVSPDVKKTLELLNLKRANNLSVWQESPQVFRMLKMVETYATFGKINEANLKELLEKRANPLKEGQKVDAKKALEELKKGKTMNEVNIRNCFRLSPPKKGYDRAGIKKPFKSGGALGDRKEEINDLISRMI